MKVDWLNCSSGYNSPTAPSALSLPSAALSVLPAIEPSAPSLARRREMKHPREEWQISAQIMQIKHPSTHIRLQECSFL